MASNIVENDEEEFYDAIDTTAQKPVPSGVKTTTITEDIKTKLDHHDDDFSDDDDDDDPNDEYLKILKRHIERNSDDKPKENKENKENEEVS